MHGSTICDRLRHRSERWPAVTEVEGPDGAIGDKEGSQLTTLGEASEDGDGGYRKMAIVVNFIIGCTANVSTLQRGIRVFFLCGTQPRRAEQQ